MRNINFNSPLNLLSDGVIYNDKTHRYRWTTDKIAEITGDSPVVSEGSIPLADRHMDRISQIIYTYMYSRVARSNRDMLEFRISRDTDLAQVVLDAQLLLYEADRINGAVKIYYQHMMDTNRSPEDLLKSVVPPIVVHTLENANIFAQYHGAFVPDNIYRSDY